jgi:hypothetical protein
MKPQQTWEKVFLPRLEKQRWTWKKIFLLVVALFLFIDLFFVPFSPNLDPSKSGESILFFILAFRATSRGELPTFVVVLGTCVAALASSMNHGLLKSPSFVWTPLAILLTALVLFWGLRKSNHVDPPAGDGSSTLS